MTTDPGDPIPRDYDHWRHCITHWCGIPLTRAFLTQRIAALEDPRDEHTGRFIQCYGADHHRAVLDWFRQALKACAD